MIDLVVPSRRIVPAGHGLENFSVLGEKRVWIHLVIDRFAGKVMVDLI